MVISRQSCQLSGGLEIFCLPYLPEHVEDHGLSKANAASQKKQVGDENEDSSQNKT